MLQSPLRPGCSGLKRERHYQGNHQYCADQRISEFHGFSILSLSGVGSFAGVLPLVLEHLLQKKDHLLPRSTFMAGFLGYRILSAAPVGHLSSCLACAHRVFQQLSGQPIRLPFRWSSVRPSTPCNSASAGCARHPARRPRPGCGVFPPAHRSCCVASSGPCGSPGRSCRPP